MPKKNRVAIYEYLFKEGVMVAKKDYHASKHPELENIPNLQVIKAMQVKSFIRFFHIACIKWNSIVGSYVKSFYCIFIRLFTHPSYTSF